MPLMKGSSKKAIELKFHELKKDNMKKGKERGSNGKPRSRSQIIAIALNTPKRKRAK